MINIGAVHIKSTNISKENLKILGIHFSYNKKVKQEKNIDCHVVTLDNVLKLWKMRDLSIEGKITIFKTLTIFKKYILV